VEPSKRYLDRVSQQMQQLQQAKRNLLVVSDFHLSEGFRQDEGLWSINEDFFFDGPLARFLQFAEAQRAQHAGAPWRLICNGDILDFRQVGLPRDGQAAPGVTAIRAREAARRQAVRAGLSESEQLYGPGTSPLMSGLRVDLVYQGHPGFFQALAWFIARGNEVVFIKGNHDVELHWPKVQASIKRLLEQAYAEGRGEHPACYGLDWSGLPAMFDLAARRRVFFLPWNYYEPGRVYIEHGQQFHATDSQQYILWPVLPWDENELELSLGELFGRYFVTQLETLFPLVDNMKPFSKGISWVLARGIPWLLSTRSLWEGLKELGSQFGRALRGALHIYAKNRRHLDCLKQIARQNRRYGESPPPDLTHLRGSVESCGAAYEVPASRPRAVAGQQDADALASLVEFEARRRAELEQYGAQSGLGASCACRLDALKSLPQLRSRRLLWELVGKPLLMGIGALVLAVGLWAVLTFLLALHWLLAALMVLSLAAVMVSWLLKVQMVRPQDHLMEKAADIHRVLQQHGKGVRYVLMGHDHHAHLERLDTHARYGRDLHDGPCYYVNSGTWTALVVHDPELVRDARQFSFVRLQGDVAHVMRWNDGSGAWEPVVLR